jgi:hypothetical protein
LHRLRLSVAEKLVVPHDQWHMMLGTPHILGIILGTKGIVPSEMLDFRGILMVPGGGAERCPVLKTRNLLILLAAENAENGRNAFFWYVLGTGVFRVC